MFPTWLAVMFGGALGALARYATAGLLNRPEGFPYGTLTVNLLGCWFIGALWQALGDVSATTKAFVFAGVLGGFTTFSSFGLESLRLLQSGQTTAACAYVLVSNVGGLALVALGSIAARAILQA